MKTRAAFVALILLVALRAQAVLPFDASAHLLPPPQVQQSEKPAPGPRFDSMLATGETRGTLFENVVAVLEKRYYDQRFRTETLPKLVLQYADRAKRATSLGEQRDVVQQLLSHIPASHLGLLSRQTYRHVMYDLQGLAYPTFGFQVIEIRGKFYSFAVLEGGPGERAGLLAWDRIVSIDSVPVEQSSRLDWRSDDAYITDDRDPPVHYVIAREGDTVRIKVERRRGKFLSLTVPATDYSAFAAAKASARIHAAGGRSFGYLHFWYIHMRGVPELLKEKLEGEFRNCDGLILDLRGRGGNGLAIARIIDILRLESSTRHRPIVALVDRQSRSAKDVLAYELKRTRLARLVGERTAGAVIPATFADVGYEAVLMFPSYKLLRYTDLLEFKPVEPDLFVERAGPLSAGDDPILKAGLAEALNLVKPPAKQASANRSVIAGRLL